MSVDNYREKAITQAQIKIEIIDHLLASLPEDLYDGAEINAKADEVFVHLMGLSDAEINQVVLH